MQFMALKNLLPKATRLMYDGVIYPFAKGEIKIVPSEVGNHGIVQYIHLPQEVKNARGEIETISVPHKKFMRLSLEEAFKAGVKMEENPQIENAKKKLQEEAELKAKIRAEVIAEMHAEAKKQLEEDIKNPKLAAKK